MSFSSGVKKFTIKAEEEAKDLRRAIIYELFSRVVLRTPVDTGRARGNWIFTVNRPDLSSLDTEKKDRSGKKTILDFSTKIKGEDGNFNLTNNLPYIGSLEDGKSGQAPSGMVKVSLHEIESWIRKNVRQ